MKMTKPRRVVRRAFLQSLGAVALVSKAPLVLPAAVAPVSEPVLAVGDIFTMDGDPQTYVMADPYASSDVPEVASDTESGIRIRFLKEWNVLDTLELDW
jgi:hypothetical protein